MYGLRHSNSWRSGGKGRTEKLWSKYGRERNFHIPKKLEIANFNSQQKVQDFRFLNGIIHHVTVDGAVSSNPLTLLTHE